MNENYYSELEIGYHKADNYSGDDKLVREKIDDFKIIYPAKELYELIDSFMNDIFWDGEFLGEIIDSLIADGQIYEDLYTNDNEYKYYGEHGVIGFIKETISGQLSFLFSDLGLVRVEADLPFPMIDFSIDINPETLKVVEGSLDYY